MHNGGILTGPEIRSAIYAGDIEIDPLVGIDNGEFINPASYDLTLGSAVAVYRGVTKVVAHGVGVYYSDMTDELQRSVESCRGDLLFSDTAQHIDAQQRNETWKFKMGSHGWLLKPGIGYLMHTAERVTTKKYVPVLDGKSSLGRLFITAHVTAGYGDPGFDGQYTLEVVATHPVVVYPGMRFCQMRFHTPVGEILDYGHRGHYTGKASMGPVPSMSYRQFEEQRVSPTGINAAVDRGDLTAADSASQSAYVGSGRGCHNG